MYFGRFIAKMMLFIGKLNFFASIYWPNQIKGYDRKQSYRLVVDTFHLFSDKKEAIL